MRSVAWEETMLKLYNERIHRPWFTKEDWGNIAVVALVILLIMGCVRLTIHSLDAQAAGKPGPLEKVVSMLFN